MTLADRFKRAWTKHNRRLLDDELYDEQVAGERTRYSGRDSGTTSFSLSRRPRATAENDLFSPVSDLEKPR